MSRFVPVLFAAALLVTPGYNSSQASGSVGAYATRTSQGEISFQLTPRPVTDNRLVVDVQVTTHSGDLSNVDLQTVVTLQVGGRTYQPIAATRPSGHHATGSVTFEMKNAPERFTVTIAAIRGMGEQRFEWP